MILKQGVTAPEVLELKRRLNAAGGDRLDSTNPHFGPKTEAVVRWFQSRRGLVVDGEVDTEGKGATWDALGGGAVIDRGTSGKVGRAIIAHARLYVGLTEIKSNAVWDDKSTPGSDARSGQIRRELIAVGHELGAPYCAAFAEAVVRAGHTQAGQEGAAALIGRLLNPHVMTSFRNCQKEGLITREPVPGALGFMRNGRSDTGHAYIVERIEGNRLWTIQGNTSDGGSTAVEAIRNGDGIYDKWMPLDFTVTSGLHLLGFLNPIEEIVPAMQPGESVPDGTILVGDGTWPWTATIDGDDIVVGNARATAFGGDGDPQDSGETASGINTKGNPGLLGCSLPMDFGDRSKATKGSPLPRVPWKTLVRVTRAGVSHEFPVIDLGPGKRTGNALDLTVAAARKFNPSASATDFAMRCDFRILDGAKHAAA